MAKKMNFTRRNRTKRTIENVGFMQIKDAAAGGVELYIYGDIVSSAWDKWTSEDTCPQDITDFLNGIDNNAELTVYFNSCGGDVFAGIGIYNILKRHKGHITGIVDGIAASIASVILMACDDIVVSTGAQIMIHKPLTMAWCEIDFVVDTGERIVPVEVKAEVNLRAKSLKTYHEKFAPEVSVRTSMADYKKEEWLVNLPLYAIDQIIKL